MRCAATITLFLIACCSSAEVPSSINVKVVISSHEKTCTVLGFVLACNEIGSKLNSMGISTSQHIELSGDPAVNYELVRNALDSLHAAGYSTKIAFVKS